MYFFFGLIVVVIFKLSDWIVWIIPYPVYFFLTIVFAWLIIIRININLAKLPKQFVYVDNLLFAIQMILLFPLIYLFFNFDLTK